MEFPEDHQVRVDQAAKAIVLFHFMGHLSREMGANEVPGANPHLLRMYEYGKRAVLDAAELVRLEHALAFAEFEAQDIAFVSDVQAAGISLEDAFGIATTMSYLAATRRAATQLGVVTKASRDLLFEQSAASLPSFFPVSEWQAQLLVRTLPPLPQRAQQESPSLKRKTSPPENWSTMDLCANDAAVALAQNIVFDMGVECLASGEATFWETPGLAANVFESERNRLRRVRDDCRDITHEALRSASHVRGGSQSRVHKRLLAARFPPDDALAVACDIEVVSSMDSLLEETSLTFVAKRTVFDRAMESVRKDFGARMEQAEGTDTAGALQFRVFDREMQLLDDSFDRDTGRGL